jgi:hypothetical protein
MAAFAALVAFASLPLSAQSEPTLLDMAVRLGGMGRSIEGCGPAPSLANVVRHADLIVEGIVKTRASYLTPDERDIFTDYEIAIRSVLFQREVLASSRPGVAIPVIFKSRGGQVVINGLRLTVDVQANSTRVTLNEGDQVYLFAERDRSDGKWLVNPFDVFKVNGPEVVTPALFSDLPRRLPSQAFIEPIFKLQPAPSFRP